jgi:molecular chaperone HtpG
MFLKEEAEEFLKQERLEEIIKHHSEFITFPITLYKMTTEYVDIPSDEEEKSEDKEESEDGLEVEEEKVISNIIIIIILINN